MYPCINAYGLCSFSVYIIVVQPEGGICEPKHVAMVVFNGCLFSSAYKNESQAIVCLFLHSLREVTVPDTCCSDSINGNRPYSH